MATLCYAAIFFLQKIGHLYYATEHLEDLYCDWKHRIFHILFILYLKTLSDGKSDIFWKSDSEVNPSF